MSPVRFLENTTLPAPIMATLIISNSSQNSGTKDLPQRTRRTQRARRRVENGRVLRVLCDLCGKSLNYRRFNGRHTETASGGGENRRDQAWHAVAERQGRAARRRLRRGDCAA